MAYTLLEDKILCFYCSVQTTMLFLNQPLSLKIKLRLYAGTNMTHRYERNETFFVMGMQGARDVQTKLPEARVLWITDSAYKMSWKKFCAY